MASTSEFDEFYAGAYGRVLGQVYAMSGNLAAAEDSVAEAFARAWQNWSRVQHSDSPEAWVRVVAIRIEISTWRKTANRWKAHRRSVLGQADPPGLGPDHVSLVEALRKLPEGPRHAIVLHYFADAPVEQIARDLGRSTGTVKSWLVRGRKVLAEHFEEVEVSGDARS